MGYRLLSFCILMLAWSACGSEPPASDWMLDHANTYLTDATWRRAELEASLWMPELPYARKRLAGYALDNGGGWDQLPLIETGVTTVGSDPTALDVYDGELPQTRAEWLSLGERAFWQMPMRRDVYLEWLTEHPELWDEVGLQRDERGNVRGLVRFTDARGDERVGATCALCHGDAGLAGRATRTLDLGHGRELFSQAVYGRSTDYETWGAGKVDITDDGVVDALSIPDLWGVSHQPYMNHSGAIALDTPAALAIRFETQYVVGHSLEARPDRAITWALMMFVYSLEPPARTAPPSVRGEQVFARRCAGCHVREQGYAGRLVDAALLSSDPQSAHSALRGTGAYKTSSLIAIADGAPYLHDGSIPSLRELVRQHPTPADIDDDDVTDLLSFLKTL